MRFPVHAFASFLATAALSAPASAQQLRNFCSAAAKPVQSDPKLSDAVTAAFGPVVFTSTGEECIYPLQVLRFPDADVLLTQGNVPGDACHGCSASLSGYVLRRTGGGLKLVRRFPDFAQVGTFGAAGDISPLAIGGDDGFVAEGGGTFQGYSFTNLDFYVFRAGKVVHLKADPPITISADNGGAMTDERKAVEVSGSWSVDPADKASFVVGYKIKARGRSKVASAVWSLRGDRLVLTRGPVPPEVEEASGGAGG